VSFVLVLLGHGFEAWFVCADRARAAVLFAVANDDSAKATEARIASEAVPRRVSVACADTLKGQPIDC
jgi:hypothetical protein